MTSPASHRRTKSDGRLPVLGIGAGLLLLLLAACPGTLPEPLSKYDASGTGTGTGGIGGGGTGGGTVLPPCDAPAMILTKDVAANGCMGASCHNVFSPNFMTETKASLAAKPVMTSTGSCVGMPLLNTANPAASVILKRVQGAECGEQMPSMLFLAPRWLNQAEIDCIAGWVMAP